MTIRVTFTQRQTIDKLIAAGKKGIRLSETSPTAFALVRMGYAEWQEIAGSKMLVGTTKAMRFYQRSPDRSDTSKSAESADTYPGASSETMENSSSPPNSTTGAD